MACPTKIQLLILIENDVKNDKEYKLTFKESAFGLELTLSIETGLLVVSVTFSLFHVATFFSFFVFGVCDNLGLGATFLATTPLFLGFFFCGGGSGDESLIKMSSGTVSVVSPSTVALLACINN